MTARRWLQLGSAVMLLALLSMLAVIWRSAADEQARATDIRARTEAAMERIEAEAARIENAAR